MMLKHFLERFNYWTLWNLNLSGWFMLHLFSLFL